MHTEDISSSTRTGTFGGTILVILLQINWTSLLQTVLVAAIGAGTSFLVSVVLGFVSKKLFRREDKDH